MKPRREFNGVSKLRHYLQVVAFTLVVATIQCTFMPTTSLTGRRWCIRC